jgi:hypothetical protein
LQPTTVAAITQAHQSSFNTLLPVFGTWVGVVITFYFGSKQFEMQAELEKIRHNGVGDSSLSQVTIDCARPMQGSNRTVTLSAEQIAHASYKLTGNLPDDFSVIIPGSWDGERVVFNNTNRMATIKAKQEDNGVSIPSKQGYSLLNDGSKIVRAE